MSLKLGDTAPNFKAQATGYSEPIDFHEWAGPSWTILFSHPADFSISIQRGFLSNTFSVAPVCTTELGQVAKLKDAFLQRNTKPIALSVDKLEDHDGTRGCH